MEVYTPYSAPQLAPLLMAQESPQWHIHFIMYVLERGVLLAHQSPAIGLGPTLCPSASAVYHKGGRAVPYRGGRAVPCGDGEVALSCALPSGPASPLPLSIHTPTPSHAHHRAHTLSHPQTCTHTSQMFELLLAVVGSARLSKLIRPMVAQMAYTAVAYMQVGRTAGGGGGGMRTSWLAPSQPCCCSPCHASRRCANEQTSTTHVCTHTPLATDDDGPGGGLGLRPQPICG